MHNGIDLTLIVMTYNGQKTLERALESIRSQTYRNMKIVIVDDSSSDQTMAINERFAQADPRVTVIRHEKNKGLRGNFLFCSTQVSTPYFTWLHQDDFYQSPDYLTLLMAKIKAENLDLAFPAIQKFRSDEAGNKVDLPSRNPHLESTDSHYQKHKKLLTQSYIGYQVIYGVMKKEILGLLPLWLDSIYGKEPDEEPYCHFVLSRFSFGMVPEVAYVKDMTSSHYYKRSAASHLSPIFWNTVASIGLIAQSPHYSSSQKLMLAFLKTLRSAYTLVSRFFESTGKSQAGQTAKEQLSAEPEKVMLPRRS